jgi:tight adherence protein C
MILYLIPVVTALTLLVTGAGIYQLQFRRRRVADRLQRVVDGVETETVEEALGQMEESLPVGLRIVSFLAWLMPGQVHSEPLYWELAQAGYRHMDARKVFVGVRVFSTALFGLLATLVSWQLRLQQYETIGIVLVVTGVGYYLPLILVRARTASRQQEITLTLPDALDLLVICVEAGQGLNAALLKVGRESAFKAKALSEELTTLNNEMRAGVTRIEALRNLALRTGVTDVRALTAVMIQSDKLGSSIADALRIHAESLRIRRRQRAEEAARKAPVKLVFPLVLCIFPELLVVVLAPGMLQLFRALAQVNQGG